MTQDRSDGREPGGGGRDGGPRARDGHRAQVLSRASAAVRQARTTSGESEQARAVAEEILMVTLENRARMEAEGAARSELEADVRRYAVLLREEGAPPEVAVRRLKDAVEPVVFSPRDHDGSDVEWRRGVVGDVVKWFVEAYYAV